MSITFERILCPTDFSELAERAVGFAKRLASVFDSQLYCCHVVDEAYQYWSSMGPESIPVVPATNELLELAGSRMEKWVAAHYADLAGPVITHLSVGRPFADIIAYSRQESIDLIVMATHGRGAISHLLLGSTTEKVVRKAPCAVMTVRSNREGFVMP